MNLNDYKTSARKLRLPNHGKAVDGINAERCMELRRSRVWNQVGAERGWGDTAFGGCHAVLRRIPYCSQGEQIPYQVVCADLDNKKDLKRGLFCLELLMGFGPMTSSLPMTCSTD